MNVYVLAQPVYLIGRRHESVKLGLGHGNQPGMGHPGAVMALTCLADFILTDFLYGQLICLGVVLDGDLSGHATDGVHPSAMAGLDDQLCVGAHTGPGHGYLSAIGENVFRYVFEALNKAENVIPASAV